MDNLYGIIYLVEILGGREISFLICYRGVSLLGNYNIGGKQMSRSSGKPTLLDAELPQMGICCACGNCTCSPCMCMEDDCCEPGNFIPKDYEMLVEL